ncbi:hypothetical protein RASY3_02510 [Ruminococcus albus SY3]|uniref:Uncharacterized protein n=1 Tax=Ruminococcus albus SY3 TaxID=1341156 RepID=A0A011W2J2_RUMAL|nr:hypothetical protein [Ruminococcus albus]EXM38674.1 hypothetical protein RASY3_18170 [Ruminococcus albus SY3]EXM41003.1 hypothetical protein RASY3_02510 [Ruminococcus albus SY3]
MPDETRLDEQQKIIDDRQDNIKKLKNRRNIRTVLNILLTVVFIIICTFSIYRRYDEARIFDKPVGTDDNQQKINDNDMQKDDNQQKNDDSITTDNGDQQTPADSTDKTKSDSKAGDGHFTIYSVGDVYTAENGSGKLHCDVRNVEDSTHDIVMSLYISEDELKAHGLSTNGVEDGKWLIAQSGLFEPGYKIGEVQLNALPDGSYLPAGSYSLTMNERYYHHETGVLASYEANIPVTLEVAN